MGERTREREAAAAAAGDVLIVPQTPTRRYSVMRTPIVGEEGAGGGGGQGVRWVGDVYERGEEDGDGGRTPLTPSMSIIDEDGYQINSNQMHSNQGGYQQEFGEERESAAGDGHGGYGWDQHDEEVMLRGAHRRGGGGGWHADEAGWATPGRGKHPEESSQFGRVMRATPQTPNGVHAHRFACMDVRQRVDQTVQGGKEVLDVVWAAGRDASCSEVLYVLGRATRELPRLQVLRCVGLEAVSKCQDAFRLLLLLIRKHPSLWSLNLARVPLTPGQQTQLCHALRTCHVSHMACEATGRYLETMVRIAASNARKHTLWMLSSDSRQNSVIQTVQGCWHDPMDHPDNIVWLQDHARPKTPAPRPPRTPRRDPGSQY